MWLPSRRCGFNPWVRKIPWRRKGNPLQYSCLGNPWTEESGRLLSTGLQKSQTRLSKATNDTQTVKCIHTVKPIASIWHEAVLQMQMSIYPHSDQDIEYFQHYRACMLCNPSQIILHPKKYPLFWLLAPSVGFTCSWVT